ncbi:helix-turn-helix domain-containing protein [Actinomadura parmotrematis]|uniref:Helix-turn-helix domain-containing protein n=1 Tax=Actinomadura parmotrematis TaxID=2864039 RepID=A0ABS7FP74_9ACTN|nr:helix-turn-helix transcriptional regulator [Actinomadura parmotrematis]MBW8482193.1 helix-turn-helix domain-containing protein [Actinomadura parmotrematis]
MPNPAQTVESIAFGRVVLRYRRKSRLTQDAVATGLNVVRSYISQVETGRAQCREDFAIRLDPAVNADGAVIEAWHENIEPLHEQRYPTFFADYERDEQKAVMLRAYEHTCVYGLLQTKAYAAALLRNESDLANRLDRQRVLERDDPPTICAVLSEAVLYTEVGSPEIMREQLEFLWDVSDRENVHIQVAPFHHYRGVWGEFHIATQRGGRETAYIPSAVGGLTTTDPAELSRVASAFATLTARSLNVEGSRALIRRVIEEKWT